MEWIKAILEKHTDENGKVNMVEAMKEINKEFPKNAVPKDQYNNVSEQLKTANQTLTDLQESTKDNPDVQKQLQEAETSRKTAEAALAQLKAEIIAKDKLRPLVTDVDYALFKMGGIELDEKGEIKDFDNKLKQFKEDFPAQLVTETEKTKAGYKVVDTKLKEGQTGEPLTKESIMKEKDAGKRQQLIADNMDLFK